MIFKQDCVYSMDKVEDDYYVITRVIKIPENPLQGQIYFDDLYVSENALVFPARWDDEVSIVPSYFKNIKYLSTFEEYKSKYPEYFL